MEVPIGSPKNTITIEEYYQRLVEIHRVGDVGVWYIKAGTQEIVFSELARKIYEVDPGVTITIARLLTIIPSEDVQLIKSTFKQVSEGQAYIINLTHGIITKSQDMTITRNVILIFSPLVKSDVTLGDRISSGKG